MARLRLGIASLVSLMWALSILMEMTNPVYTMSPFVHMAMMGVVGAILGIDLVRRNGGKAQ